MTNDPGFDLTGKRALVTGASAGIGGAVAVRLAAAGATVVAVSRSGRLPDGATPGFGSRSDPADGSERLRNRGSGGSGGRVVPLVGDLSEAAGVDGVVDAAVGLLGGLDIVVNNAGRGDWLPMAQVDRGYFDGLIGLNLWAPLRISQLAQPHLAAAGGGVIVMVGSVDAVRPSAGGVVYGASKAGLAAATVALAKEWGDDGIRVVQVDPGIVDTPMASEVVPALEKVGFGVNVVRRAGRAEEVAGLVHYLVSPLGGFATGVSYRLDGGAVAMGPFDLKNPVTGGTSDGGTDAG